MINYLHISSYAYVSEPRKFLLIERPQNGYIKELKRVEEDA